MKGTALASELKFYLDYSKYSRDLNRMELWSDSVDRVMNMHKNNPKFKEAFKDKQFVELFNLTTKAYKDKLIVGSQRALQFAGEPIMKHNAKIFNCLNSHCDRIDFFQEACYWLLCGCGVGFSVQEHHVAKLPKIYKRSNEPIVFQIPDSIEGWADAFGILISSFTKSENFKEYQGLKVVFDYSLIRPKGSLINGGFKAPGSDGLRKSLEKCEALLEEHVKYSNVITPIVAYDYVMYMSDSVLSGGVRRSATICLFSLEDKEMMNAKTGNWFTENPQRARSNNSVVLHRDFCSKEEFVNVFESIKQFGEPGFYFVDDFEQGTNPCVEIGMYPYTEDGRSGWQGCNLTSINGSKIKSINDLILACKASAFLGTLQASYTDFKYVKSTTKEIFDREALLGCSITGWMSNPSILLNESNMIIGANTIKDINRLVAKIIGINPAARTTCVKPEGNTSVLLGTASGCHGEHAPKYFRLMQINKQSEVAKFLEQNYPELIEESVWSSTNSDYVVYLPIETNKDSIYKKDLVGIKQLEIVKKIQENWVEHGTNVDLCIRPYIRHNVSNTVEVGQNDWDNVCEYLWRNNKYFTGVSFIPSFGDKIYNQAPFTAVLTEQEIIDTYGVSSLFASGLIVDGLHVFNNLWDACTLVENKAYPIIGTREQILLRKDWIRRVKQFAKRYLNNDLEKTIMCLKDVHLLHKWVIVNKALTKKIDLSTIDLSTTYTDIDTLGAIACQGGACEITF